MFKKGDIVRVVDVSGSAAWFRHWLGERAIVIEDVSSGGMVRIEPTNGIPLGGHSFAYTPARRLKLAFGRCPMEINHV